MSSVSYEIYPSIGIARVGDSVEVDNDFFIGPEAPGVISEKIETYRDNRGNVKRQAARFRVYQFTKDDNGNITKVKEMTSANSTIKWKAHLANRKAAYRFFDPELDENGKWIMRNPNVEDRKSLIIDAGEQTSPTTQGERKALSGKFMGEEVYLGDLLTDKDGRLLVLGGRGITKSPTGKKIYDWANNDEWYDDISDGPISATIEIEGQEKPINIKPAWVIVSVPSFAPGIENIVSLYDQALQVASLMDSSWTPSEKPSFAKDIYPILERTANLQWVSPAAMGGHGSGKSNILDPRAVMRLASNSNDDKIKSMRTHIFSRLTPPNLKCKVRDMGGMPLLKAGLNPENPLTAIRMSLTPIQYEIMRKWSEGEFISDWQKENTAPSFDEIPVAEQPNALNKAALEACVGGPFHPGIECSYAIALPETYSEPFRICEGTIAGGLTEIMALPWHTDFKNCDDTWWPSQRPTLVTTDGEEYHYWSPEFPTKVEGFENMIDKWGELGFILKKGEKFLEFPKEK